MRIFGADTVLELHRCSDIVASLIDHRADNIQTSFGAELDPGHGCREFIGVATTSDLSLQEVTDRIGLIIESEDAEVSECLAMLGYLVLLAADSRLRKVICEHVRLDALFFGSIVVEVAESQTVGILEAAALHTDRELLLVLFTDAPVSGGCVATFAGAFIITADFLDFLIKVVTSLAIPAGTGILARDARFANQRWLTADDRFDEDLWLWALADTVGNYGGATAAAKACGLLLVRVLPIRALYAVGVVVGDVARFADAGPAVLRGLLRCCVCTLQTAECSRVEVFIGVRAARLGRRYRGRQRQLGRAIRK